MNKFADSAGAPALFAFDNSYARELEGAYVRVQPCQAPEPKLAWLNTELAGELGLDAAALAQHAGVAVLAGNHVPRGADPLAQAYAGHQFGGFAAQLGDGRALLLGELIDVAGQRRDLAFKGSGPTPFSRGGDGKATLGPVLREVLLGEAMHALGIPTTRALAAVVTGEQVRRDELLPGALLTRIASSHLRVGTLEFFAARGDLAMLRRVADYAIARHDPDLIDRPDRHLALLAAVVERQAALLARWMGVGFIHGVMNTDNMTLSGETIDYGPCAFLEAYDPATVFSSIDHRGRYAYGNQPRIAAWNLARLAEALLPLIDPVEGDALARATEVVQGFAMHYRTRRLAVFRAKLGIDEAAEPPADESLVDDLLDLLQRHRVDFTRAFRALLHAAQGDSAPLQTEIAADAAALQAWLARWRARLGVPTPQRLDRMRRANPAYIARNHQVEVALQAAVQQGDFGAFERLLEVLRQPFDERAEDAEFALAAPAEQTACYRTFCGT